MLQNLVIFFKDFTFLLAVLNLEDSPFTLPPGSTELNLEFSRTESIINMLGSSDDMMLALGDQEKHSLMNFTIASFRLTLCLEERIEIET